MNKTVARKTKMFFALGIIAVISILLYYRLKGEPKEMTNLDFFKTLDYEDGVGVVTAVFERFPLQYATTLGQDGNPQIRPIEFKFEENGVLYFDTVTFYTSYAELLAHPYIQLCVCD